MLENSGHGGLQAGRLIGMDTWKLGWIGGLVVESHKHDAGEVGGVL